MGETEPGHPNNEMENDGDEEDDSYAKAYMDDDDAQESDDEELAEMLAKVQSIQQVEGRLQLSESGDVKCNHAANILENPSPRGATPRDLKKSEALPRSPLAAAASSSAIVYRSQDGIKTVLRNPLSSKTTAAGTLLGIKKSAVYEEKLLQAAISTNSLERLKQRTVAAAPAEGTGRFKANKTAKQVLYEKRIAQKANQQSFLERNYKPNNDSKTKKAQLELEAKRKAYAK
ncbi:hypothetical protein PHYBOEH_002288 [Phytophthora boehmeriae]|uniref:Uncharacterized protein n=1 Tax=Phytophthora boehmeriae TaxID=109152 RepID=A0A8T1WXX4_9STRA|nr:hypothetical protein PHYBOEH_002288 [Phytophthora boehmeriae]